MVKLAVATMLVCSYVASFSPKYNVKHVRREGKAKHIGSFWKLAGSKRNDDEESDYRDAMALNRARTDVRNFLTQRAFQSFFFLLVNCRDGATVKWLENRFDCQNIENFHGTGAFNLTKYPEWSSLLTDLLFEPPTSVIIQTKTRTGGHGLSKNNPYAKEMYVDYEFDIDPPSLVSRIVSVRDQIANEWVADLETLKTANEMILEAYYDTQEAQREEEIEMERSRVKQTDVQVEQRKEEESVDPKLNDIELTVKVILQFLANREVVEESDTDENVDFVSTYIADELQEEDDDDDDDDDEECLTYSDESDECVDMSSLMAPYSDTGHSYEEKVEKQRASIAYDRTSMIVLGNNIAQDGRASSPYRKSSFDLLGLLATQESIHRVLRQYREAGDERDVSYAWFREFYVSRVADFFDGSQHYGRADDFLETLLLAAPAMKEMNGNLGFIDPLRIAEDVISMRSEVVDDWRDIIEQVPSSDHSELRKLILNIQMGNMIAEPSEVAVSPVNVEDGFQ